MREAAEIDVAVFGGGIAGLWLLARLRALGSDALLFEKTAFGPGQTIAFAKNTLQLPLPFKLKAGLVGVKDYQIAVRNSIRGLVLQNSIEWETEISSYDVPTHEVASPFFVKVWKVAGVEWTMPDSKALAQYVEQRGFVAKPAG